MKKPQNRSIAPWPLSTMLRRKQQKLGVDVNTVNDMGKTLLILAAHLRDHFIVGPLLEHGADATICDELGRTVQYWSHISVHLVIQTYMHLENRQHTQVGICKRI